MFTSPFPLSNQHCSLPPGPLATNVIQMMSFLDVKDGKYVNSQQTPRVQISALGAVLGSQEGDTYLRSLNFDQSTVGRQRIATSLIANDFALDYV